MNFLLHRSAGFSVGMIVFWSIALFAGAALPPPVSPSPHYIRDDAQWLDAGAFRLLDAKLEAFERETSSQFVVAIFPEIPAGEELFDFSQRLFESWKPGGKAQDNGALLLIFAENRMMRIHTGQGMEGVLPDARCKQIIADVVAPRLREGNREAAINAGVDTMIAAARGEYHGTGTTQLEGEINPVSRLAILFVLLIVGCFMVWGISSGAFTLADVIFTVLGASRVNGGGPSGWGGGGGGGGGGFSGGGGSSGGGGASGSW